MSTTALAPATATPPARIPPLQNGDRLTRDEFERRFDATPDLKNAELLEGVVYMAPPVSHTDHAAPHSDLTCCLIFYRALTPGVLGGDNASCRLDMKNMPQPDVYLFLSPVAGGQAKIEDRYVVGAPELVAEVSATTASYDLHVKLDVYRRNGVREYIVWRVFDRAIDYFVLRDGRYEPLPLTNGLYQSEIFPGLWLSPSALIAGDIAAAIRTIQEGCATPEHQAFAQRLAACI